MSAVTSHIVCVIYNVGMGGTRLQPYIQEEFKAAPGEHITVLIEENVIEKPTDFLALMRDADEDFKTERRGSSPDPIAMVCSNMLNPTYVTQSNVSSIATSGGFVLKVYAVNNYGSRSRSRPEQKRLLGVCTVYVTIREGRRYLYIATICALNIPNTMKGISSRTINSAKHIATALGYAGVTLDSLLYCRNPMVEEVETNKCLAWLHDYYLSQGFVLVNPHITDPDGTEIMEYSPTGVPGRYTKIQKTNKKYKFSQTHTVPMIWHV